MQVFTRVSWDMRTGILESADAAEYFGPVAECKGETPDIPKSPPLPRPPTLESVDVKEAQRRELEMWKQRKGLWTTILTQGLEDVEPLLITKKLLGA